MKLKFWGSRGSIPAPVSSAEIEAKLVAALVGAQGVNLDDEQAVHAYVAGLSPLLRGTTGGNTSCVSIQVGEEWIVLDAGSGLRMLGQEMMKGAFGQGRGTVHILLSHTHWDHILGFPFFGPLFVPGNRIFLYSPIPDLEQRFRGQQAPAYFPITLDYYRADIDFVQMRENVPITVAGVRVSNILQKHPGRSYGFRLEADGVSIVYATDAEYDNLSETSTQRYVEFMRDADMLIFDAQYTLSDSFERLDWGHSSSMIGVDIAVQANVKRLVLFHFAPTYTDQQIREILERTLNYAASDPDRPRCEIDLAIEGWEIELGRTEQTRLVQRSAGEATVLAISGRFDASAVSQVDERLTALISDSPRAGIVIDLSGTTHLSIAGLKVLLSAQRADQGAPVVLAGAPDNVREVLSQVGFSEAFEQYGSIEQAVAALEAQRHLGLQGQTLHGRYVVQGVLHAGRKAAVFKAFDTWLERPVTVKGFPSSGGTETDHMLLNEARAMAHLKHPNIVSVYDCVEYQDRLYLVREFVEGWTLRVQLDQLGEGERLPPRQVLSISRDILAGLAYAHAHGVLHRYLRPQNVILSEHELRLMNFGLLDYPREAWSLEAASYMAPEQLGDVAPTERTDLYSLGVILYEMVTGRLPYLADTVEALIRLRAHAAPVRARLLCPSIPPDLERLIAFLLDADPDRRLPSAVAAQSALLEVEPWPTTPH
jgi:anti-anti-sigma factor